MEKIDSMKKIETIKYSKSEEFIHDGKWTLKRFGFIKPSSRRKMEKKLLHEQRWIF